MRKFMAELAIILDPAKLENPDGDIRYELPERLVSEFPEDLSSSGFEFLYDGGMAIFISILDDMFDLNEVIEFLARTKILGNFVLEAATLAEKTIENGDHYVFYPDDLKGRMFRFR